mmetsp:Transcript_32823/g.93150  ORF Transcript_32823/g.93150 Transcript_32823/m.93150 type:complete len:577 (+) Transcript_32823:92-1822(+)
MSREDRQASGDNSRKRARPLLEELPHERQQHGKPNKKAKADVAPRGSQLGSGESKFARALGSTDYQTREKGLSSLSLWLASRSDIPELDLLKLWKGVFYCFWHSDKAPVQDDLAKRLSGILLQLQPPVAYTYFSTFLKTIRREWLGIDRLRLDKFMLLIRYFLRQMLVLLQNSNWERELVQLYMLEVQGGCLLPADTVTASGVAYHLADIYVDEVDTVTEDSRPGPKVLVALLQPFLQALTSSPSQPLLHRIRDNVFHVVAERCRLGEGAMAKLDGPGMSEELFRAGSEDAAGQKNRVVLYELSKVFNKAARKAGQPDKPKANGMAPTKEENGHGGAPSVELHKAKKPKKGKFVGGGDVKEARGGLASAREAVQEDAGEAGPREEAEAEPTPKKKKKGIKATTRSPTGAEAKEPSSLPKKKVAAKASADTTETPPRTSKKALKLALRMKREAAGGTPSSASEGEPSSGKGSNKPSPAVSVLSTPKTALRGSLLPASLTTAGKKSVRFAMKQNLYFPFGGPLPDPDVRTPPPARPKGPALKKVSAFGASKTPNMYGRKRAAPQTPRSAPRPSAVDFF